MDDRLLLVNSITLLYRESQLIGSTSNSSQLVSKVLDFVKIPENIGIGHQDEIIAGLRSTAIEMCRHVVGHEYVLSELLQRLRLNCGEEIILFESIRDSINEILTPNEIKRQVLSLSRTLEQHFRDVQIQKIWNEAGMEMRYKREKIPNMGQFVSNVFSKLEPFMVALDTRDPAIINEIDFSNLDEMDLVFDSVSQSAEGNTILRTGWQAVNRMLDGGIRRGEEWVIGALQHNYKTGFSLSLFKQLAMYNKPVLDDPNKKPIMVRFTFEDSADLNMNFLFSNLKQNETGTVPDIRGVPIREMSRYVSEQCMANGYHIKIIEANPSDYTYRKICEKIIEIESQGFEVHLVMLDYLLKVPTTGCDTGPHGHDIRNMYERIRNFMSARRIAVITPHQLSTDAKMNFREGKQGFVQSLVGGGYYAGCKQIDQVVDGEIFIHIEKLNGEAFLTVQRGKHRKTAQTPFEDLYTVLKFQKGGFILDDINGDDTSLTKVGGGPRGSGQETPFWDLGL